MVCEKSLAYCAKQIDLGEYLLLGKGEDATGGRKRDSVTSDALEALIGAVYLDGGFSNAKEFIHKFVLNSLFAKNPSHGIGNITLTTSIRTYDAVEQIKNATN